MNDDDRRTIRRVSDKLAQALCSYHLPSYDPETITRRADMVRRHRDLVIATFLGLGYPSEAWQVRLVVDAALMTEDDRAAAAARRGGA